MTVAGVKTWLGRLSETTQRLLLASLLGDGQLQPAKAADLLQRLRELVEARGAQQLAERLSYHVLRSLCATLELELSGSAPTKDECLEQFVAFVGLKGLRFTLAQLGVEDLDVLSNVRTSKLSQLSLDELDCVCIPGAWTIEPYALFKLLAAKHVHGWSIRHANYDHCHHRPAVADLRDSDRVRVACQHV
jgi:hypothetical protein